jgi:hypothetical protein
MKFLKKVGRKFNKTKKRLGKVTRAVRRGGNRLNRLTGGLAGEVLRDVAPELGEAVIASDIATHTKGKDIAKKLAEEALKAGVRQAKSSII